MASQDGSVQLKSINSVQFYLLAMWMEGILWTLYTSLIVFFLYLRSRRSSRNTGYVLGLRPATAAIFVMYLFSTVQMMMTVYVNIEPLAITVFPDGFHAIVNVEGIEPPPFLGLIYGSITHLQKVAAARDVLYITNMVIGDSIMIWRLFAVWNGSYMVTIVPILLTVATTVLGYWGVVNGVYTMGAFSSTILFNFIVTLLIAGRIWSQAKKIKSLVGHTGSYHRILLVVVESGAVLVVGKLTELLIMIYGGGGWAIAYMCMAQITGFVPMTIMAAVTLGLSSRMTDDSSWASHSIKFAPSTTIESTVIDGGDNTNMA